MTIAAPEDMDAVDGFPRHHGDVRRFSKRNAEGRAVGSSHLPLYDPC